MPLNDSSFELRPMYPEDLDMVMDIENKVYPFPWSKRNFEDSINSGYSCWVGIMNSTIIGYFVLMATIDEAHLLTIGVSAKHQGKGFGARLLSHAIDIARFAGMQSMLLEVRPSNEKAIKLYEHFGFKKIGVRKGYYPDIEGREDALVFTRTVDEVLI